MSTEIRIPMLSMGMEEGKLSEWLAADGDAVVEGAHLYSIESDKSVFEVTAPAGGVLHISGEVGETYPVGAMIGSID